MLFWEKTKYTRWYNSQAQGSVYFGQLEDEQVNGYS